MDTARFDALARRLGGNVTRRGALSVLASLVAIGAGEAAGKDRHRRTGHHRARGGVTAQITDGVLDGNGHPYVGLMVAQDAKGKPLWRCSGTLLSSQLFLTAGHCTEAPAAHVEIWFQADVESGIPANGYPNKGQVGGTPHTHPQYNPDAFYQYDLGVVVLDKPMKMKQYGALPTLDVLDGLTPRRGQKDVTFTAVGYGLQQSFPDAASWKEHNQRVRMVAYPHLLQINTGFTGDGSLLLSNNANTGGTCFGDSGGPNFIGTSNVVGGVTSFGLNDACGGTGGVYRVDRADDLDWLHSFTG
ncbi:MAG: trypsin-like serine protease [Thermomicrobiales bacterium]